MKEVFKAVRITDDVYWVGAIDWGVRNFHGYATHMGTTYNAYLILADKVALMDTVKAPFRQEMLARIASVIEPTEIDYLISNHSEMDHSGAIPETIQAIQPEKVFASVKGAEALEAHFHMHGGVTSVKNGESLSLGNRTLTFLETRMLHWPDSMVSYLAEEKLLFSQDAFGMHLASYERFDDELDAGLLEQEAAKYYANILLPLSNFVGKQIQHLGEMKLPLDLVAPDHGPIWRRDIEKIIGLYARWAEQKRTNKAIVVYDTMWHSTELMARAVGEGLHAGGAKARLMPMSGSHRSDVATELLDAGALIVGAPTINQTLFPTMADVMTYLKGLRPKGLIGGVFGSYGWSGESAKDLRAFLEEMKVELVGEPIRQKYVPADEELKASYELGLKIAERLKALAM